MPAVQTIKLRRGTAAAWTSANPTLAAGEPGLETDTGKLKVGDGSTAWTGLAYFSGSASSPLTTKGDLYTHDASADARLAVGADNTVVVADSAQAKGIKWAQVGEAMIALADVTTLDVSTAKHGLVPKAPNDAAKFLRGDATWATIGGTGTALVASDPIWDAKGDLAAGSGADAAVKVPVGANGQVLVADSAQAGGVKWASSGLGGLELVYRYTVVGSDKASIDTGVDAADAGSNDWTNGDVLEVWFYGRTDETTTDSATLIRLNNDAGATSYKGLTLRGINAVASATNRATSALITQCPGASAAASVFGATRLTIPNYAGTVGFKTCEWTYTVPDAVDANVPETGVSGAYYASTSAITRFLILPNTAGKKFKVGSKLLIYKRLAS